MPSCNIRNVDDSLMRKMKVKAAQEGLTLRDWVLRALAEAADETKKERRARERVDRVERPNSGVLENDVAVDVALAVAENPEPPKTALGKMSYEEYSALSNTEKLRALREGRYS